MSEAKNMSAMNRDEQGAAVELLNEGELVLHAVAGEWAGRVEEASPASMFATADGVQFVPEDGVPRFDLAFVVPFAAITVAPA